MTQRTRYLWILGSVVAVLFVAGMVWRAVHPGASEGPREDLQIVARQHGYYLCLHRRAMTAAQMYRLVKHKLPRDDVAQALRGCQEAQKPSGD
jgi:hypothetical protein